LFPPPEHATIRLLDDLRSWLKQLAHLPHQYKTWLGSGHTIPAATNLKRAEGVDAVIDKMEAANVTDVLDPARPNMVPRKKFLGPF
jgi:hypothetical protein